MFRIFLVQYIQIMGGGGNCDIAMVLYKTWDNVQNENTPTKDILSKPTVQIRFYSTKQVVTKWFNFLDEKLDEGNPLPMPDPTKSNDPVCHEMLPSVVYATRFEGQMEGRRVMFRHSSANLSELRAATIMLEAVARVITGGHLVPTPGAVVGDERKYYRFDEKFEVTLPRALTTAGETATVRVKFPSMLDPSQLSWLQVRVRMLTPHFTASLHFPFPFFSSLRPFVL